MLFAVFFVKKPEEMAPKVFLLKFFFFWKKICKNYVLIFCYIKNIVFFQFLYAKIEFALHCRRFFYHNEVMLKKSETNNTWNSKILHFLTKKSLVFELKCIICKETILQGVLNKLVFQKSKKNRSVEKTIPSFFLIFYLKNKKNFCSFLNKIFIFFKKNIWK